MGDLLKILLAAGGLTGCAAAPVDAIGDWGGEHVAMTVGSAETTLEFDCAHGKIAGPFVIGEGGRFGLDGIYVAELGGPVRQGEMLPEQQVRYSGAVRGDAMTLAIGGAENPSALGDFQLAKDRAPSLLKCL